MPSGIYKRIKGLKRKPLSEERKAFVRNLRLGKPGYWLGKKHSEEHRHKISLTRQGFKHSEETKRKIGEASLRNGNKPPIRFGKANNKWKGGITPENRKVRTSTEYKLWRKSVFERDKYICQKCGQVGNILRAHHIRNFNEEKELRTSISNGITLCDKCHKKFHIIYGIKKNNLEQLKEYGCQL